MPSDTAADNHCSVILCKRPEIILGKKTYLGRYHSSYARDRDYPSVKVSRKDKIRTESDVIMRVSDYDTDKIAL